MAESTFDSPHKKSAIACAGFSRGRASSPLFAERTCTFGMRPWLSVRSFPETFSLRVIICLSDAEKVGWKFWKYSWKVRNAWLRATSSTVIDRKPGRSWALNWNSMPISPARIAAFEILLRVEREDSYASELLHASRYSKLSIADHGLATELVMGVLRWRSLLDKQIAQHSSQKLSRLDPEVLTSLRLGAYQLLFLDRVPERAAVHESVEVVKRAKKRSAVPFANAVLRKFSGVAREQDRVPAIGKSQTSEELGESSAHPLWLVERWLR